MKSWLLALIPALVAGVLSIGPFLWERVVVPKYLLEYSIKELGRIERGGKSNIIYSIGLSNKGSDRLTGISIKLKTSDIIFDTITTSPDLIDIDKAITPDLTEIKIATLHSGQNLEIGLLAFADAKAKYSVTAYLATNETIGKLSSEGRASESFSRELILAALSTALVFLTIGLVQFRIRFIKNQFRAGASSFAANAVGYVATANNLQWLLIHAWNHFSIVDYFGAADLIYCEAQNAADKRDFITALKCLFLAPDLPEAESEAIKNLIVRLDPASEPSLNAEISEIREKAQRISDLWSFRKAVDQYLSLKTASTNSTDKRRARNA